jgi:hypothetical protein
MKPLQRKIINFPVGMILGLTSTLSMLSIIGHCLAGMGNAPVHFRQFTGLQLIV